MIRCTIKKYFQSEIKKKIKKRIAVSYNAFSGSSYGTAF